MKKPEDFRSARWYAPDDLRAFGHRSRTMQMGYGPEDWAGKPVIAIVNTWSDINQCHAHFKHRVEDVKRGIYQAGRLSDRAAGDLAERAAGQAHDHALPQPAGHRDRGAVALASCRRRGPDGRLRQDHAGAGDGGGVDAGLPFVFLPAGPMLSGRNWRGQTLGSGSDVWKYWDERRAGNISDQDWVGIEGARSRAPSGIA